MRFVVVGVIAALLAVSGQTASEPVTADTVVVGRFLFIQKTLKSKNPSKLLLKERKLNKEKRKKLRPKLAVVVAIRGSRQEDDLSNTNRQKDIEDIIMGNMGNNNMESNKKRNSSKKGINVLI